jgi:hypothetical protein
MYRYVGLSVGAVDALVVRELLIICQEVHTHIQCDSGRLLVFGWWVNSAVGCGHCEFPVCVCAGSEHTKWQATLLWQAPCECVPYGCAEGQTAHWNAMVLCMA